MVVGEFAYLGVVDLVRVYDGLAQNFGFVFQVFQDVVRVFEIIVNNLELVAFLFLVVVDCVELEERLVFVDGFGGNLIGNGSPSSSKPFHFAVITEDRPFMVETLL